MCGARRAAARRAATRSGGRARSFLYFHELLGNHTEDFFYRGEAPRRFEQSVLEHCQHSFLPRLLFDLLRGRVHDDMTSDCRTHFEHFVDTDTAFVAIFTIRRRFGFKERHFVPIDSFRNDTLLNQGLQHPFEIGLFAQRLDLGFCQEIFLFRGTELAHETLRNDDVHR